MATFLIFSLITTMFLIFSIHYSQFSPHSWLIHVYTAVTGLYVILSGNSRILLVEDDSDLLQLFHDALASTGFQVDGFTEPLKAYSHFQENSGVYDLVISDVRMPGLSGIQLAKKIKEVNKDVKVFLMSAFDMTDDRSSELKEIQLNEFLQKPFHMQQLVSMVEKYIGQRAITNFAQIAIRAD